MTQISLTLPLPPAALSGHNSGHWRNNAKLVKDYRALACIEAKRHGVRLWRATVDYHFWLPNKRRTDAANLVHRCKPYIDGCVDAGLIPDDCWELLKIGSVFCGIADRKDLACVVLTFRGEQISDKLLSKPAKKKPSRKPSI